MGVDIGAAARERKAARRLQATAAFVLMRCNDSLGGRLMADARGVAELGRPSPRATTWRSAFFGHALPADDPASHRDAQQFRYCAFLSYGHRDAETARWLHESLEKYRVPRNAGRTDHRQWRRSRRG